MDKFSLFSQGMTMVDSDQNPSATRVIMNITLREGGFFAGHFHNAEGELVFDDAEIYRVSEETPDEAVAHIFLKNPAFGNWVAHEFSKRCPWILIPPGWPHAGLLCGSAQFNFTAFTQLSHTRVNRSDGNVVWLNDDEQPLEILKLLRALRES